jgi:hypothetical protein
MTHVKVKLIKPLDGMAIGDETEFSEVDAKHLESLGAVKITGKADAKDESKPADKDIKAK